MGVLGRTKVCRWIGVARTVAAVILLATVPVGTALAHKDKLPSDALSLVRQAAALLAQDPKMQAEARERLEVALASKDVRGVDLTRIRQARDALAVGDIAAAPRAAARRPVWLQ